jgi:mRNA interferase MazF
MSRGDIILVELPRPIGAPGHEQFGKRPAIIIQDDEATKTLSTVVIVPLTTTGEAIRFFGAFTLEPNHTNGLDQKSIVLTHQIGAIDKRRINRKIGGLNAHELAQLEKCLSELLRL